MQEVTRTWLSKAKKELANAGFAMESIAGPLPVTTALHCQLSAENYLKAFLSELDFPFSHTNSLVSLFELCKPTDAAFESLEHDIAQLRSYSIASRYPALSDSLQFREQAIASAMRVRDFVLTKLI